MMTPQAELSPQEVIRAQIAHLRQEHRDLDDAIGALVGKEGVDALMLRRLKKQKLALKDRITRLEDQLLPDIIA